jgi:hypothetical protein
MAAADFTPEELATEEWRPVVGFERWYAVSSLGRVMRTAPARNSRVGRILKPQGLPAKYLFVYLYRGIFTRRMTIHRLVLSAFIGDEPDLQANHIDGVKGNNRISNLEWVTAAQNLAHASRIGLLPTGENHWSKTKPERIPRGEAHSQSKLTESDVVEIRRLRTQGISFAKIGKRYHVSDTTIIRIAYRKCWKHVP